MATRYVRTDSTAGGDGTEDRTDGATRAFPSLSACEAAMDDTLTEPLTIICSVGAGTAADTTPVAFGGWVTSADNYVLVRPSTSNRHAGIWDDTKYRLVVDASAAITITNCNHLRLDGLQIATTGTDANYESPLYWGSGPTAGAEYWVSNCILKGAGGGTNREPVIYLNDADVNLKMWNCLVYGTGTSTSTFNAAVYIVACATADIYNCTLIGGKRGINNSSGTVTCKNTYAYGEDAYVGTIGTSYCASSVNAELSGTGDITSAVAYDTTTFVSATPGNADYLKPNVAGLLDGAGNAPGGSAPLNYTTDIAGATVSTWDIGAFNYADAGASFVPYPLASRGARGGHLAVSGGLA